MISASRYFLVGLLIIMLSGCATKIVRQDIPIPVPCKAPETTVPTLAIDTLREDADIFEIARALWASLEEYEAYGIQLEAALKACR